MEQTIQNTKRIQLSENAKEVIVDIVCFLLILTFIYTAYTKGIGMENFAKGLMRYPVISDYANLIKWTLPGIEILLSLFLIVPKTRKLGLWGSLILMLVFTIFLLYMNYVLNILGCSCGGIVQSMSFKQHIVFNITLIVFAILAIKFHKTEKSMNTHSPRLERRGE